MEAILGELDARERYIREIVESGIRKQREVAEKILAYDSRRREGDEGKPQVADAGEGVTGASRATGALQQAPVSEPVETDAIPGGEGLEPA